MNFLSSEILLLFPDGSRQKYKKSPEFIPLEIVMRCAATGRRVAYIPLLKNTSHCD